MNEPSRNFEKVLKFVGPPELPRFYRFGPFRLSPQDKELFRNGEAVRLMNVDPGFDRLRGDLRFTSLLQRLGLV